MINPELRDSQLDYLVKQVHSVFSPASFVPEAKYTEYMEKFKNIDIKKYKFLLLLSYKKDRQELERELSELR